MICLLTRGHKNLFLLNGRLLGDIIMNMELVFNVILTQHFHICSFMFYGRTLRLHE